MSFPMVGSSSVQQCRVLVSHHLSGERLTMNVTDAAQTNSVVWAISDSSGNGALSVAGLLAGRALALASLTVSSGTIIFSAPDDIKLDRPVAPTIDSVLSLLALKAIRSIRVCFTSTLGASSNAVIQFALGENLDNLVKLQRSIPKIIPWPA